MSSGFFHPIDTPAPDENPANTRMFKGDGTPFLKVTGLKRLEACRAGSVSIPLEEVRRMPVNSAHTEHTNVTVPMVDVQHGPDGAVLLRSIMSNDGIWQEGVPVFVSGEWDDSEGPQRHAGPQEVAPPSFAELKAVAEGKGLQVLPGTSREKLENMLADAA